MSDNPPKPGLQPLPPPPPGTRLRPNAEMFNELMRQYGNPVRAHPLKNITQTLAEACLAAGIDPAASTPEPSRIVQA